MVIDINKLKQQGKTEEEFSFTHRAERPLIDLPNADIPNGIEVSGTVRLSGRSAFVEGEVKFTVLGECSRCLSPASRDVSEEFYAEYSVNAGAEYPIKAWLIDLTEPVEEAVITSCPLVIYCREDCKGICPVCGANLNDSKCNCNNT